MGAERQPLDHTEILGQWVGSFIDELVACGLRDLCLCPGSRSTPLAVAFTRHPDVKLWTHLDERSCAYFALGMAKAAPEPYRFQPRARMRATAMGGEMAAVKAPWAW